MGWQEVELCRSLILYFILLEHHFILDECRVLGSISKSYNKVFLPRFSHPTRDA